MKNNKEYLDEIYDRGSQYRESEDFKAALDLFMQGAKLGDSWAQHAVGVAYDFGEAVPQDKKKAIYWYKKAWRTDSDSCHIDAIAKTYVEIDQIRNAIYWWRKAVALNDGSAALSFAQFLLESNRANKIEKAKVILKVAIDCTPPFGISEAEHEEAQELLEKLD